MPNLLWSLVGVLVVLWLLGFTLRVAGNLIHLVLVRAIALAIYNFAMNRDAGQGSVGCSSAGDRPSFKIPRSSLPPVL